MDYEAVIEALGELVGREVVVAIQFSDESLSPIAVLRGRLTRGSDRRGRFEVDDGTILVAAEDLADAEWVAGLGEEPALRIDLHNVQVTVSPGTWDMAELLG